MWYIISSYLIIWVEETSMFINQLNIPIHMDKIYIKTLGCSQNYADSEMIEGLLSAAGFNIVQSLDECDLAIINTCTVKGPTDSTVKRFLTECEEAHKRIIIAGCYPQSQPSKVSGYSVIGPSQIPRIVSVVEETLAGNIVTLLVPERADKLSLPIVRKEGHIEIIPISQGCLGECTYCIVRLARGVLLSYPKDSIQLRMRRGIGDGVSQIWLTSQDTGCYGMDNDDGYHLPELLKDCCGIPGDFLIRLGMANPDHVIKNLDPLIEAFKHPKMFKFLHIPVQSGSDEVLKRMRRKYTVDDFKTIVKRFREEIPRISISTDIICGFPGETKEQFIDTLRLIQELKPETINRSRFWSRPGTKAEAMKDHVHPGEIKDRSRFLSSEHERISYEKNKSWVGWSGKAIIESTGKDDSFVARNFAYKPIIVFGNLKLGQRINVKIFHSSIYDLRGRLI